MSLPLHIPPLDNPKLRSLFYAAVISAPRCNDSCVCPRNDHGIHLFDGDLKAGQIDHNNSIADAVADLGRPEEIGKVFAGFQQYLYEGAV